MAASPRSKPEPPRTETRDIPTLTDVVRSAEAAAAEKRTAPPPQRVAAGDSSHRKALERLIYKKLHQRLPRLAQELAADILKEVETGDKPRNGE